jgi:predicted acylesterase/phospholipase RssA
MKNGERLRISASDDVDGVCMTLSRRNFFGLLSALGAAGLPMAAHAALPPWYPLPPPLPIGKGRALVVSGAGARGAYEAGVLKWLYRNVQQRGQPFDVICGTSAGAINAAFAAQGTPQSIQQTEELWKGMPGANVLKLEPQVQDLVDAGMLMKESGKHGYPAKLRYLAGARRKIDAVGPPSELVKLMGLVDGAGIDGLVKKYPLSLDALQTSLVITATNMTQMSADSFYKFVGPNAAKHTERFLERSTPKARMEAQGGAPPLRRDVRLHHALTQENFVDAVLASAAVPGVFQPVAIKRKESDDTNLYVDGGVANNTPVGLAVDAGATDITVILIDALDEIPTQPESLPQLLRASNAVMSHKLLENDVSLAIAKNLLGHRGDWSSLNKTTQAYLESLQQRDWNPITLRVIRPRSALKLTLLGFNDQADLDAAFAQGYADAQEEWIYSVG